MLRTFSEFLEQEGKQVSDPNFDWQIDVDPEGTNDGKEFDGTGSQSDDNSSDDDSSDDSESEED
jgi:hypothetical protein